MHVDKYKQTGSEWKRFVGRDGGMKQKQSRWREAGQTKPTLDHLKRATRLDFMQKKKTLWQMVDFSSQTSTVRLHSHFKVCSFTTRAIASDLYYPAYTVLPKESMIFSNCEKEVSIKCLRLS